MLTCWAVAGNATRLNSTAKRRIIRPSGVTGLENAPEITQKQAHREGAKRIAEARRSGEGGRICAFRSGLERYTDDVTAVSHGGSGGTATDYLTRRTRRRGGQRRRVGWNRGHGSRIEMTFEIPCTEQLS